ncbi:hypothetical protein WS62_09825 [Burkholderia sp. ABCPW 14]|nr:hypothetical protein WS62_09825 [Burkholderia sp. ABCPW 14]
MLPRSALDLDPIAANISKLERSPERAALGSARLVARAFSVGSPTTAPCCAGAGSASVRNVITAYPQYGWDVLAKRDRHRRRTAIGDAPGDRRGFAGASRGVR